MIMRNILINIVAECTAIEKYLDNPVQGSEKFMAEEFEHIVELVALGLKELRPEVAEDEEVEEVVDEVEEIVDEIVEEVEKEVGEEVEPEIPEAEMETIIETLNEFYGGVL